ncbi:uncharacterized protein LOC108916655, partial [Anoplophora glabripennis]|uniref:uncharacterized protein LOC108916655 n=1 Tax=Anoplophora glabripennis TaxID=217634 RepID=UPI0008737AF0
MSRPLENITAMNPSDFKETSCRLCLKNITEESFEVIDDATRDILDVFLLKIKFGDGSKVICNACRGKLNAALEFKTMCGNTDNTIISYMDCEKMLQLDLREVYMKEKASEQLTDVSYDQKICRLCMQPADSEFRCILEEELDIIEKFIPEM